MKNLRVRSTAWPHGVVRNYGTEGMERVSLKCQAKTMKTAVMNEVRPGGVCHMDGQESALEQAKQLVS